MPSMAAVALLLLAAGCDRSNRSSQASQASQASPAPATQTAAASQAASARDRPTRPQPAATSEPKARVRDLSIDESMGGHTLARHVAKTDDELRARLKREPQISAASTYTDVDAAERTVGASLAAGGARLRDWEQRRGRRPNLVLDYKDPTGASLGRSLARGQQTAVVCARALVVLRWDERAGRYYVLTSYPEAAR